MRRYIVSTLAATLAVALVWPSTSFAQQEQEAAAQQERQQQAQQQRDLQQQQDAQRREARDADDRTELPRVQSQPQSQLDRLVRGDRIEAGISEAQMNNVRGTLAAATEAALERGQLNSLVERFIESDRDRFGDLRDVDTTRLDQTIERLEQVWKQRYDEDFDMGDREDVFPQEIVRITPGLPDVAQLAAGRQQTETGFGQQQTHLPGAIDAQQQAQQGQQEGQQDQPRQDQQRQDQQRQDQQAQAEQQRQDQQRQQDQPAGAQATAAAGRGDAFEGNAVTVHFPDSRGMPGVQVPLVNEGRVGDAWRIDVPQTVNSRQLVANLQRELDRALEQQQEWPADVNEARRLASHSVMAALMGQQDGQQQPAAQGLQQQQQQASPQQTEQQQQQQQQQRQQAE